MSIFTKLFSEIFRDYVVDGNSLSGANPPNKVDIRAWGAVLEGLFGNDAAGAWTPALQFGGATTGITYVTRVGAYTRIRDRVLINGYLQLSSKGSATGVATIAGLPVEAVNYAAIAARVNASSFPSEPALYARAGSSLLTLEYFAAGNVAALDNSHFGNTTNIIFGGSYQI